MKKLNNVVFLALFFALSITGCSSTVDKVTGSSLLGLTETETMIASYHNQELSLLEFEETGLKAAIYELKTYDAKAFTQMAELKHKMLVKTKDKTPSELQKRNADHKVNLDKIEAADNNIAIIIAKINQKLDVIGQSKIAVNNARKTFSEESALTGEDIIIDGKLVLPKNITTISKDAWLKKAKPYFKIIDDYKVK